MLTGSQGHCGGALLCCGLSTWLLESDCLRLTQDQLCDLGGIYWFCLSFRDVGNTITFYQY